MTNAFDGQIRIVTLRARNWPETVRYYKQCVGLKEKFVDEPSQYAMFDAGSVRFAIEGLASPAYAKGYASGALMANFQVADLAATVRELAHNGAQLLTDIRHGPGYDYVALADPEGNEHIVYQHTARKVQHAD
ncbi:MAG TPA: VOC family protein [Ramlibacter sp.]|nr:VOC family protein [Ramlibacter sp.]